MWTFYVNIMYHSCMYVYESYWYRLSLSAHLDFSEAASFARLNAKPKTQFQPRFIPSDKRQR